MGSSGFDSLPPLAAWNPKRLALVVGAVILALLIVGHL
jgi:hypothetical protein